MKFEGVLKKGRLKIGEKTFLKTKSVKDQFADLFEDHVKNRFKILFEDIFIP